MHVFGAFPHLIVALWCTALGIDTTLAAEYTQRVCFTDPVGPPDGLGNVTLDCPPGHTIVVEDALFGRSLWMVCDLTDEDCVERTQYFRSCDGFNNCTMSFPLFSAKCGGDSTTLLLGYSCYKSFTNQVVTTHPTSQPITKSSQPVSTDYTPVTNGGGGFQPEDRREDDEQDVGVVIGCAVAALVTIIMLIIAIILVIRALLQYYKKGSDGNPPGRLVSCMDTVCLQVDRLPCFSTREPESQALRSRRNPSLQRETGLRTSTTDKLPNGRVAPVGQECSSGSDLSVDSGLDEMRNSPTTTSSPTSGTRSSENVDPNNVILRDATRASKNSSHETKNCPDKVSSWRQKELTSSILTEHKGSNQNVPNLSTGTTSTHRPKFDAVAIPNTETVTKC